MKTLTAAMLFLLTTAPVFAQFQPQGAHVNLFFPQLANGGPDSGRWQTAFTFVNPSNGILPAKNNPVTVRLNILDNAGQPLALDLGSGATSRHEFTIPSGGSRILRSRTISSTVSVGWAIAECSGPVQATVSYRQFVNGIPRQEIAAQPTLPTILYTSPANRFLGVALANVYSQNSVSANLEFRDSEGIRVGNPVQITVPPLGHTAFVLAERFPSLGNTSESLRFRL